MYQKQIHRHTFYQFTHIGAPHFITGKPFNMHRTTGKVNHEMLAKQLSAKGQRIVFPQQTHSSHIEIVSNQNIGELFAETDALITGEPGIAIGVLTADCVPLLLHDTRQNVVAAIHAGWRGTNKKIPGKTIAKMQNEFGSKPEHIRAGIGPSISYKVYEVGPEVKEAFEQNYHETDQIFKPVLNGKFYLDLWKANWLQLLQAGINKNDIEITDYCTYTHHQMFYSARKEGLGTGRNAAVIKIEK